MTEKNLYIIGCGGHGKSVADVVLANQPARQIVFVDENARENETIMGFPVLSHLPPDAENIFIAVGDNAKRKVLSSSYNLINVISKTAYIGYGATIGQGCFIAHGAHIGPCAVVGDYSIINTHAVVEHDVYIGKSCHIAPHSTLCGKVHIGNECFIGVGSTIKDTIHICDNVVVGAGGIVVKDINVSGCYVGCPVKRIK